MINDRPVLARFEAADARAAHEGRTYEEALARYTALWCYAREIRPVVDADWLEDVRAAIAVARAVNGLAPAT